MTPEYFFNHLQTPINWKFIGWNNVKDINLQTGDEEILSYGKVFDDRVSKIIRISFTVTSERLGITERIQVHAQTRYKTVADERAVDIDKLNEFIAKNYK
jgi:hypothetical protein